MKRGELLVNGVGTGIQACSCEKFIERLLGAALVARRMPSARAWRLWPCRAVHASLGGQPLDVALCDRGGVVRMTVAGLRGWRMASDRGSNCAWEFPAGSLRSMRISRGDQLAFRACAHAQRGATMLEFVLALLLGVLPILLGLLQLALLLGAANVAQLATAMAARAASLGDGDPQVMRQELARALLPEYVRSSHDGTVSPAAALAGFGAALADVTGLDSISVQQRADVLALEVVHCQALVVPLAGATLAAMLREFDHDPRHATCIAAGRAPLLARAVIEMQTGPGVQ